MKVTIHSIYYEHENGTKEYSLLLLEGMLGKAVSVARWGKVGTSGKMHIERDRNGREMFQKKDREKRGRGYHVTSDQRIECTSQNALQEYLGPNYWNALRGGDHLDHLIGGVKWDEEDSEPLVVGSVSPGPKPAPKPAEPPPPDPKQDYATNEAWGMF